MGKRQHQKDKMYLTYTEWTTLYGGKKSGENSETSEDSTFRRLPFNHCCVSLQPFEHPYCDPDGNVFELEPILTYVKHFKHNPVTGKPFDVKKLIKLNFTKNSAGEYHCPVLFKVFSKFSHIVAVKTTGNVFSWEAVEQLNIKTRNWKDLINDQPFTRADLITIQNPTDASKFNLSRFHHIKNNLRVEDEETIRERNDPNAKLKTVSAETSDILAELERDYKPPEQKTETAKATADKFNAAHYSTGAVAAGFTSTVMPRETVHQAAIIADDLVRYERVKKKGYGRGILSMANSGPDTNGSQFFITFRSCRHLDRKHTVFGKIVGGLDTLNAMEKIEVDNKDRPIEDIIILRANVFVDPFQEADEQLATERAAELEKAAQEAKNKLAINKNKEQKNVLQAYHSGVGKFINIAKETEVAESNVPVKKKKKLTSSVGNFSSW
ncbi:hypothetical protein G9C98_002252 [Cotesia typhae]|uniref:RING-type E3 ubiquitin transferase n=1 Tax=Cotesia typhae TaxID=2053667 RepID=A0A8J5R9I0_9HYME|nr:hypothetical protein G9C98_002252 [Cotesia typhae]